MRRVVFRRVAQRELDSAVSWYERRRIGLGWDLQSEVSEFLDAITKTPEAFPIIRGRIRRATLRRFPYTVHFLLERDRIVVLAIFHAKRDPQIIEDRS